MPSRTAADLQRERKRKNADAQAQFRQRRANYISSLEEAVTKLEAVVLELQDSLSRAQGECHRSAEEKRQLRAYIDDLERGRGVRLHDGRAPWQSSADDGQPAHETSPISNSSHHARDNSGFHPHQKERLHTLEGGDGFPPTLSPLKPHALLGSEKERARQGSHSPPSSPQNPALRKESLFPDDPQESRRRADPHFLEGSWPASPASHPPYLPRVPPIFTHGRRSVSPPARQEFTPSSAAMTSSHLQYLPEMHQGMKLYPMPPHAQGMGSTEVPGLHPMMPRHGEQGVDFVSQSSSTGSHLGKVRHAHEANGTEDGNIPASNTLAVIKAQAFGALRRNRVHKKKGNGYATKVALDALEARGLGLGLSPTHALSSSRYEDRGEEGSDGDVDSGMED